MKIHAIQTGTVAIKSRQPEGLGHGARRQLNTFIDRQWTEPVPIYAFAIEHAEGVIVVDTGETARTSYRDYFPRWHPYFRFGLREWVGPDEEIGPQLERLGIRASDVRMVVLTHLHTDHAGGLHHFPHNEIVLSRVEAEIASGVRGRLRGYPTNRYPAWLEPKIVDLPPVPYGPFPQSLPLTRAKDVVLVPVPGHTLGQMGVVVEERDHRVFLAGDTSYTQDLMLREIVDGVSPDENVARTTLKRVNQFVVEEPTVYLVAHDPETGIRLAERRAVAPVLQKVSE